MNCPTVYSVRRWWVKSLAAVLALGAVPPATADLLEAARRTETRVAEVTAQLAARDYQGVLAELGDLPAAETDARLWNAQGVALAGLGRDREAVVAYEHGIRTDPTLGEIHLNLAVSLERLGVTGRAMAEFEQAVELEPASYEARLGLGRAALRYSRLQRARDELEAARELSRDDPRAWIALAELADAEGDVAAMHEAWEAVEARWPDSRTARRLAELSDADPVQARDWLRTCLERDPADAECAAAAGALALQAGDHPAARRDLLASLELAPDQPQVLHNLLLSYQIGGEIDALEEAVRRWPPRQAASWGVVALARRAASDETNALKAARTAVELAPEDLDLVNLLAVILDENGRSEEAIARWEWILQRDASHAEARRNLAQRRR